MQPDGQTADGIAAVTEAAAHIASKHLWPAASMVATTHDQAAAEPVSVKLLPRSELPIAHINDVDEHKDKTEAGTRSQAADNGNSSSHDAAVLVGGLIAFGLAVYLAPPRDVPPPRRRASVASSAPDLLFALLIFMLMVLSLVAIYIYHW